MRDIKIRTEDGSVYLQPTKVTHWVAYIEKTPFDSFAFPPPKKFGDIMTKRFTKCVFFLKNKSKKKEHLLCCLMLAYVLSN